MPILANPRHEAFARARAEGLRVRAAYGKAGFSPRSRNTVRLTASAQVSERVEELIREAAWGEAGALEPPIGELLRLAGAAGKLGTAAGLAAAGRLLCEAAKLKSRRPAPAEGLGDPGREARAPYAPMTVEEWLATYAPKP